MGSKEDVLWFGDWAMVPGSPGTETSVLEGSTSGGASTCLNAAALIASRISSAKTSTEGVRYSASFSRAWRTTDSICGAILMPSEPNDGGSDVRCFFMIEGMELPLKGTSPHNIWKRITPRL